MTANNLFQQALLAEAAYADFWNHATEQLITDSSLIAAALTFEGFSQTQAEEFVDEWTVRAHQPNTFSGLSVTVFENLNGDKVLAVRGTDDPFDVITDLGILEGVTPEQTTQYQELKDLVDGWLDDGTLDSGFTVSGHSLGGFLAGGLLVDYPDDISHAYIYNAPGVGGLLAEFGILTGHLDPSIDLSLISNVVAAYGVDGTADWGISWGEQIPINIEGEDTQIWGNHEVKRLTDALALYSLFETLSPSIDNKFIAALLPTGSNNGEWDLDGLLNSLGVLLGIGQESILSDREAYYQRFIEISGGIFVDPDAEIPVLKSEYENLQFVNIFSLVDSANLDNADGFAYRYALQQLTPFAITGNEDLYEQHNLSGELNADNFTESYLEDRKLMLNAILQRNTLNSTNPDKIDGEAIRFDDAKIGEVFAGAYSSGQGGSNPLNGSDVTNIIFGDENNNNGSNTLLGNQQNDRIYGLSGNDVLDGGAGDDYLEGGTGVDTYIYDQNDGFDTIFDKDGLGVINWKGTVLDGSYDFANNNTFIDETLGVTYQFEPDLNGRGTLYIIDNNSPGNGGIKVIDFVSGNLGIVIDTGEITEETGGILNTGTASNDVLYPDGYDQGFPHGYDLQADIADQIFGIDGNDFIVSGGGNDIVYGGDGNDWIYAGIGNDTLYGEAGDDYIFTMSGDNKAYGGDGNDIIISNHAVKFNIDNLPLQHDEWSRLFHTFRGAYAGITTTETGQLNILLKWTGAESGFIDGDYEYIPDPAGYDLGNVDINGDSYTLSATFSSSIDEGKNVFSGGAGDDILIGNDGADILTGGIGSDKLAGNGGNDALFGEADDDLLKGAAGEDFLDGGSGNDELFGEQGNDRVYGGDGDDFIWGDSDYLDENLHGDDYLDGGEGNDQLVGGAGDDTLVGGAGEDTLFGQQGADILHGDAGKDVLDGGAGDDILRGGSDEDDLWGGDGNDRLYGGSGADYLEGEAGDDLLEGGAGNDTFWGGDGADTFVFGNGDGTDIIRDTDDEDIIQFKAGISLDSITSTQQSSTSQFLLIEYGDGNSLRVKNGIENLISAFKFSDGTSFDSNSFLKQTLKEEVITTLSEAAISASGGDYDDNITGNYLDNTLIGNGGNDLLRGGQGSDTYIFNLNDGQDSIEDSTGNNQINFGEGISLSSIQVSKVGYDIRLDLLNGQGSLSGDSITLISGASSRAIKTINFHDGSSIELDDLITPVVTQHGTESDDVITGTYLNDTIYGYGGIDYIEASHGNNVIYAGDGDDTIHTNFENFEYGNNIIYGEGGDDYIIAGYGNDYINGGIGDDNIISGSGDDVIEFNLGDGKDFIQDNYGFDQIVFSNGINQSNIVLSHSKNLATYRTEFINGGGISIQDDILITILDDNGQVTGDSLLLRNAFSYEDDAIEQFTFSDGTIITKQDLYALFSDEKLIHGAENSDVINGSAQTDYIFTFDGNDTVYGGDGDDFIDVGFGNDIAYGGAGNDVIVATQRDTPHNGYNIMYGGNGDDVLVGGSDGSELHGDAGNDNINGGGDNDFITGGTGDDIINSGSGDDTVFFNLGDGNDKLTDSWGYDKIVFGPGISSSNLSVVHLDYDIIITILDGNGHESGDSVTISNGLKSGGFGGRHKIEVLEFSDGTMLDPEQLPAEILTTPSLQNQILDQVVNQDDLLQFPLPLNTFSDSSGDTLTYSIQMADDSPIPNWLNFDPTTQFFSGTPENEDVGTYEITVTATDETGLSASENFLLTVNNVNDAPTVSHEITNQYIHEDEALIFTVPSETFTDIDIGDTLTLYAQLADDTDLPSWLEFDSATQTFIGTPSNDDVGTYDIQITALDNEWGFVNTVFTLTVSNTNDAPIVSTEILNQVAQKGSQFTYTLPEHAFTDPDIGDVITLQATVPGEGALPDWLIFDPVTATFSGTPVYTDVGDINVQVTATDIIGESTSQSFVITVQNTNTAPTVSAEIIDQLVTEGDVFNFALPAASFSDEDVGDSLTYTVSLADDTPLPAWLSFDPDTQTFSGTPSNGDAGVYNVKVVATDSSGASVSDIFDLIVESYTSPPAGNEVIGTSSDEQLLGSNEADLIKGLQGNDDLYGFAGNDQLEGGSGDDWLAGGNGSGSGSGDDTLLGGDGNDTLFGEDGDDTMDGGDGNDHYYYYSGGGQDVVTDAGDGQDILFFNNVEPGRLSYHQDGDDLIVLVDADLEQQVRVINHFLGGNHAIMVQPNGGYTQTPTDIANQLTDLPAGNGGGEDPQEDPEEPSGTSGGSLNLDFTGDDVLVGTALNEVIASGAGNDELQGLDGNDRLIGGEGNDTYVIHAGEGHDVIVDTNGTNIIHFSGGLTFNDVASGLMKSGNDLILNISASDTVRVAQFFSHANTIEKIIFDNGSELPARQLYSAFGQSEPTAVAITGELVLGDGRDNSISGTADNDVLLAGRGEDTLQGLAGDDQLIGGAGDDTYVFGTGNGQDTVIDTDGVNVISFVDGIGFNDVASGLMRSGDDLILNVGGSGDSVRVSQFFTIANTIDRIEFENGSQITASQLYGAFGVSAPTAELVTEDALSHVIGGSENADTLTGSDANDMISGYGGDDLISGGLGNDTLDGGGGNDRFLFGLGDGDDTIIQQDANTANLFEDVLAFDSGITHDELWFSRQGDDLQINIEGTDDQVTITDWYSSSDNQLDKFETDSMGLMNQQLDQLVSAMANYDVPKGAGNFIPQDVKDNLQPVLASSWTS
ncbi:Alkaline phosphatase [Methylophaga frappieri]|uniref:Alkaline phosphatase n=2 Tax=Methylophaga frappieri (strain ATCC BAA-2434 / DSM 25690 / JAM7) TaxID=754477 RepID=I1YLB3_METFJ|nr:Alkaline phosphatase [Methylophaga frappieri]